MAGWEKLDLLKVLFDIGFPIVQYQEMDWDYQKWIDIGFDIAFGILQQQLLVL